jgi:hypothetical protein
MHEGPNGTLARLFPRPSACTRILRSKLVMVSIAAVYHPRTSDLEGRDGGAGGGGAATSSWKILPLVGGVLDYEKPRMQKLENAECCRPSWYVYVCRDDDDGPVIAKPMSINIFIPVPSGVGALGAPLCDHLSERGK